MKRYKNIGEIEKNDTKETVFFRILQRSTRDTFYGKEGDRRWYYSYDMENYPYKPYCLKSVEEAEKAVKRRMERDETHFPKWGWEYIIVRENVITEHSRDVVRKIKSDS